MRRRDNSTTGIRFYEIEPEVEFPSVTSILSVIGKPALVNWAAKQERDFVKDVAASLYEDLAGTPPMKRLAYLATLDARLGKEKAYRKTMAAAADIGTQAHALVEWNLRKSLGQAVGPEPRVSDKAAWAFMAFEDWQRSVKLRPVAIEQTVWSHKYGYAGTLDLMAYVNDVLTVCDVKTAKAIYWEHELQIAAYAQAVTEMGHGDPRHGLVIRLPKSEKDPAFEVLETQPFSKLFPLFLNALALFKARWEADLKRDQAKQTTIDPDPLGIEGYPK